MANPNQLMMGCLNELNSERFRDLNEMMVNLLNYLEEKDDPTSSEIELVNTLYESLEKIKLLQASLRKNANIINENKAGSLLRKYYDNYED